MATPATPVFVRGLDDLQRVRLRTVELIAPLSQQDLNLVPAPGRWSVGEIVDHVILAADTWREILEDVIRLKRSDQTPFVRRTFSDIDVSFAFLPKSLLPWMETPLSLLTRFVPETMRNFLIQNKVLPFHAPSNAVPRHGLPAHELKTRLLRSVETVNSLFQDNADLNFQEMAAHHPMFGDISMANLPDLMASHELRHQNQIVEVLRLIHVA